MFTDVVSTFYFSLFKYGQFLLTNLFYPFMFSDTQIGDLLTKLMPGPRLKELIGYVLW